MDETTLSKVRQSLINVIKSNDVIKFKKLIQEIKNQVNDYSIIGIDLLAISIKNNTSPEMVETVLINDKYETLNYLFEDNGIEKTPLSLAIENCNFEVANLLIEYGANINSIPYYIFHSIININNSKYILEKSILLSSDRICRLIKDNKNFFIKQMLNNFYFNTEFILKFLLYYQKQTTISNKKLEYIILKENNKIKFNESMYEAAIFSNNYEALNLLYLNDTRENSQILKDIFNVYCAHNNLVKSQFIIQRIKNIELKSSLNLMIVDREKLKELIIANNVKKVKIFLKEKNKQLEGYNEQYDQHRDLLKLAVEHDLGIPMINFIIQQGHYDNLNYIITVNDVSAPLLYFVFLKEKYQLFEFLIEKGANINYGNIFISLYFKNCINNKNIRYFLNVNLKPNVHILQHFIIDGKISLLETFFNFSIYNNQFVLDLLSIYEKRTLQSHSQLQSRITIEKNKFDSMMPILYNTALDNNNYEAISILNRYDYRNNNTVSINLFQLFQQTSKKYEIINKIKNKELKIAVDDYFLNNLIYSDDHRRIIKEYIKEEDLCGLKNYIMINNFSISFISDYHFDPLIYAIQRSSSYKMVKFIVLQYPNLNYSVELKWYDEDNGNEKNEKNSVNNINDNNNNDDNDNNSDDSDDDDDDSDDGDNENNDHDGNEDINEKEFTAPLLWALVNNDFKVADLLIEHGANINYNINYKIFYKEIGYLLNINNCLNFRNLNYLLKHGYIVTFDFIASLIKRKRNAFIKLIFNHFVFDHQSILKFLFFSKNRIPLSQQQLNDFIHKQQFNIYIGYYWYKDAIAYHNNKALDLFMNHSISVNQQFGVFEVNQLLVKSFDVSNFYFIKKLFQYTHFDINTIDINKILELLRYNNSDSESSVEEEGIGKENEEGEENEESKEEVLSQEEILKGEDGFIENNTPDIIKYFVKNMINNESFSFHKFQFETLLELISRVESVSKIKYLVQLCLDHPSFDFAEIDFEKIINISMKEVREVTLMKWIIEKSFHHPTFDFKRYHFESLLIAINYYRDTELLRYFIKQSLAHETFDFTNITIKKILFFVVEIDGRQSIFDFYIQMLLGCENFRMKYVNLTEFFSTISKMSNSNFDILNYVNKYFIEHPTFDFNDGISIESLLITFSKLENIKVVQYFSKLLLHHKTLNLQCPLTIKKLLFTLCKINNIPYTKFVLEQLFSSNKFNTKIFKSKSLYYEKMISLANKYHNQYIIEFINNYLINRKE